MRNCSIKKISFLNKSKINIFKKFKKSEKNRPEIPDMFIGGLDMQNAYLTEATSQFHVLEEGAKPLNKVDDYSCTFIDYNLRV